MKSFLISEVPAIHLLHYNMTKLQLTQILGNSSQKAQHITFAQDCLLYICGSYIIFYNPVVDEQICYLQHTSPNITCISVSKCQRFLAICSSGGTGTNQRQKTLDSIGKKNYSSIFVYDLDELGVKDPKLICTFKGHRYQIDHGVFSPDGKYFVSVCNKDGSMFTWQCKTGQRVAQNKNSKKINSLKFLPHYTDDPTTYLVSTSRGSCKLWQFSTSSSSKANSSETLCRVKEDQQWILSGRNINLTKKLVTKQFIDLCFWGRYILLLTSDGLLCMVLKAKGEGQKEEKLQKCVDLMMSNVGGMDVYQNTVMCGGENAVVKVIDLETLTLVKKFPKPPPTKKQNIEKDMEVQDYQQFNQSEQFPQCTCVKTLNSPLNKFTQYIVTIYENMTIFIWRPQPLQIIAMRSIISHRGPIHTLRILDQLENNLTFFATVGEDNTLRIWHIYNRCLYNRQSIDIAELIGIKRNAYCRNLTRIVYLDSEKDKESEKKLKIYVVGFIKKYVVAVVGGELIIYSLSTFEVASYEVIDCEVIGLDVQEQKIFLGLANGTVTIFSVGQADGRLNKVRQIEFGCRIKNMLVLVWQEGKNSQVYIAVHGEQNQLHIYSLSKQSSIKASSPCQIAKSGKNLLLQSEQTLWIYSIKKEKQTYLLSLKHELEQGEHIKIIKSNQIWIIAVTDKNKILIANYSPAIAYTHVFPENINDIQISKGGQLIAICDYGNIFTWLIHGVYGGAVQAQVQKWVGRDMSWMEGSVWANRKSSGQKPEIDKLPGDVIDSVRLKSSITNNRDSIKLELPNVDIKYKTGLNDQSIFNPSDILKQAKQIYKNIDGIEKKINPSNVNQKQAEKGSKKEEAQVENPSLEQLKLSGKKIQNKPPINDKQAAYNSKKRIFGLRITQNKKNKEVNDRSSEDKESQNSRENQKQKERKVGKEEEELPSVYRNNLVSSIVHSINANQQAESRIIVDSNVKSNNCNPNYSQFVQQKQKSKLKKQQVRQAGQISQLYNNSRSSSNNIQELRQKQALFQLRQKLGNDQYISQHYIQLTKIQEILDNKIQGKECVTNKTILDRESTIKQFSKLSNEFIKFLEGRKP